MLKNQTTNCSASISGNLRCPHASGALTDVLPIGSARKASQNERVWRGICHPSPRLPLQQRCDLFFQSPRICERAALLSSLVSKLALPIHAWIIPTYIHGDPARRSLAQVTITNDGVLIHEGPTWVKRASCVFFCFLQRYSVLETARKRISPNRFWSRAMYGLPLSCRPLGSAAHVCCCPWALTHVSHQLGPSTG